MFGSVILDVAIGLILVYLLLSLVSAAIREWFAGILKIRSTTLDEGMHELLGDPSLVADLYNHPLINSLYRGTDYYKAKDDKQLPSYIPAKSFSAALFDMIVRGRDVHSLLQSGSEARVVTPESIRAQITRIQNPRVQRAVLTALDAADGDLAAARANVEHWFDATMDRVSGWYKQRSQIWVFLIGLSLVVIADADSLNIARRLYTDPAARAAAVGIAAGVTIKDTTGPSADVARHAAAKLDSLGLPLVGWEQVKVPDGATPRQAAMVYATHARNALIGWLITALAISFGAPFWFDTLGRVMVIRSTVKPNQKSPIEASDDRQTRPAAGSGDGGGSGASAPARASQQIIAVAMPATPPPSDFRPQQWESGHPDSGAL